MQRESTSSAARRLLVEGVASAHLDDDALIEKSSALAALLIEESSKRELRPERARRELLRRLMSDPVGQAFTTLFTDRVFRDPRPSGVVDAARQLLRRLGIPQYLPAFARLLMKALLSFGPFVPGIAARGILAKLQQETAAVVLSAEDAPLREYLARRKAEGVRVNLNLLGEAVLGEREAQTRLLEYLELLERPDVDAISVKISSVFSQIDLVGWYETLDTLTERLVAIYQTALAHRFTAADGASWPKLVNLDMESYRDLGLTVEAFKRALSRDDLLPLTAGIALQAYLPDSFDILRELTEWSRARCARGGAPIRVRLVKGANLLAERAESSQRGYELPIFSSKAEVDASFKRMLEHACQPQNARVVQLGIASHNAFDVALGLLLREHHGVQSEVSFEVLEGMAGPLQRTLVELAGTLVYAPVVKPSALQSAIAYLMRRLDEGTAEENYLRQSIDMRAGDERFAEQRARFEHAVRARNAVPTAPRRTQDRAREARQQASSPAAPRAFTNEPDTDFSIAANRAWLRASLEAYASLAGAEVASRVGGERAAGNKRIDGFDPSRPGVVPYSIALAGPVEVDRALELAARAAPRLAATSIEERAELLRNAAAGLRRARGELIAVMLLDAGKRVEQADVEISEAIDFAEYYAESFMQLTLAHPEVSLSPSGVGVVTPPWNFPLAIPAGGVFALLMSGHPVILKPALETALVAQKLCEVCWSAGVAGDALQLVLCEDGVAGRLLRHARVSRVVLTGATETARLFVRTRPGLGLVAETGGKNAIIVTARADRDQALVDVVSSAFGHSGQKCSACSLLILEDSVHADKAFMEALRDATASLPVGSSWDGRSVITPLVQEPAGPLLRALSEHEVGESWLVQPSIDVNNPRLMSPGIKLGVTEGSFMHRTELFGPVLGVMRADDFDHALKLANGTPYGLTAGLHSLDEAEQARFVARMRAGNLYVNRGITGAIVRRQPFGGMKASSFGPGAKAGGPNYVAQLCTPDQLRPPAVTHPPEARAAELVTRIRKHLDTAQRERLGVGACSYGEAYAQEFGVEHDPSGVLGERNVLRYRPCEGLLVRAAAGAELTDVLLALVAGRTVGARITLSIAPELATEVPWLSAVRWDGTDITLIVEATHALAKRLPSARVQRLRCVGNVEWAVAYVAENADVAVLTHPVLLTGRVELLAYVREQSVTTRFHRFGNLAPERLLPPLRARGD
jgi:RHH-type proline utilization regulon transcriptional repressor/proline dehydrogenase/delta 1-pyrroline-5-carboxylate dehydrogenase